MSDCIHPSVPASTSTEETTESLHFPMLEMMNKLQFIQYSGNRLEQTLRNSISIKSLIEQENSGIGHMTITDCLNVIQDLYMSGKTDFFDDIMTRRKLTNTPKSEIERENEAYRQILEYIMHAFSKKTVGYQTWAETIRILLDRIDKGQYDSSDSHYK